MIVAPALLAGALGLAPWSPTGASSSIGAGQAEVSVQEGMGYEAIANALAALAREDPERVVVESLGRSEGGREILIAVVTDPAGGAAGEKPGLFVYDHTDGQDGLGAEAVLGFARLLVEGARGDESLAAALRSTVVYVAPALDPDARAPRLGPAAGAIAYDLDFPLGWLPGALRQGAGDFPLERSETLVLARFLADHPNLVAATGLTRPALRAEREPMPAGDRSTLERAPLPSAGLVPWDVSRSVGGGLLDHAYGVHGVLPFGYASASAPGPEPDRWAGVEALAQRALELAAALPRLGLKPSEPERIGMGLWQLDVTLQNTGSLPTMSERGLERRGSSELSIAVDGARLVAVAQRVAGSETFEVCPCPVAGGRENTVGAGYLAAGERRTFRLFLEAAPGAQPGVSVSGPWVAPTVVTVRMPGEAGAPPAESGESTGEDGNATPTGRGAPDQGGG